MLYRGRFVEAGEGAWSLRPQCGHGPTSDIHSIRRPALNSTHDLRAALQRRVLNLLAMLGRAWSQAAVSQPETLETSLALRISLSQCTAPAYVTWTRTAQGSCIRSRLRRPHGCQRLGPRRGPTARNNGSGRRSAVVRCIGGRTRQGKRNAGRDGHRESKYPWQSAAGCLSR